MIRVLPFALHGSSKLPLPAEPSGQGCDGFFSGALATGAVEAAGAADATGAGAAEALALGAAGFAFSCSQPKRHPKRTAAPNALTIIDWLRIVTSTGN
jgi:hypothetical protein